MEGKAPKPTSTPTGAVFLSYASQDAEAAAQICAALRSAGVEVWFDQSELRGGDAWDQAIRKQIKTCALFIPIISKHTHERAEGYFRLEWKLAVDRSHLIMSNKAFLMPVVIDDTGDDDEHVPDKFREVQWTRLLRGETPPEFVTRITRLLSGESRPLPTMGHGPAAVTSRRSSPLLILPVVLAVALAAAAYLLIEKPWVAKSAAFSPPAHSIAVLPFVNMSGDKEQEYFSDGLTEELLNALAEINELQVAARTSSFSFKGKDADIGTIARKLNVGAILEGSVRRSGNTVRITTQLVNAVTGFHLWSQSYDRDLGDVLKLEADIANAVAGALKVTLLGDVAAKIELGGTRNPEAFDAYLRGTKAYYSYTEGKDVQSAIAAYTEAIRLDPGYALAFAWRSRAYARFAGEFATGVAIREFFEKALADAREAIGLAPELAESYLALGFFMDWSLDFAQAQAAYERALALAPGNAGVLRLSGELLVYMGQFDAGLSRIRRAVTLDPLNQRSHRGLGTSLYFARRYAEAVATFGDAISLYPSDPYNYGYLGLAYYGQGDLERARASCTSKADHRLSQSCLAVTYNKLGQHADAEAVLAKYRAASGDTAAYQYATIYAQWGDTPKALEWLDTAMRLRDPDLELLKTDPLMDPLRREPRFQAVTRELKFPQ